MGKPTGFMEYPRELPRDRSPLERIKDWREFHEHFAEEKLRRAEKELHQVEESLGERPGKGGEEPHVGSGGVTA